MRDRIHVSSGIATVSDPDNPGAVYAIPTTAEWRVDCTTSGLWITIGADADQKTAMLLGAGRLSKEDCAAVSQSTSLTLQSVLKGE